MVKKSSHSRAWNALGLDLNSVLGLSLALLLSGCATSDGHYRQDLQQHLPQTWQQHSEQTALLTDLLDDAQLNALIEQALVANPDVQQLYWQWQQSTAALTQQQGQQLPQVDLQLQRQHNAGVSRDEAQASLRVSWQVDVWQQLADQSDAAQQRSLQQQALLQAGRASLAAQLMDTWLNLARHQQQLQVEQRRQQLLQQNKDFVEQRYRRGLGELQELNNVAAEQSQSLARIAEYRAAKQQLQLQLRRLLGQSEGDLLEVSDYPQVLQPLTELPRQTLAQRPDLIAAYANVVAAESDVSVAYKDLLPSLSLEAALSGKDGNFGWSDPVWSLLGQLVAPIFQGGQLQAQVSRAEAQAGEAYAAYQSTLLTAVQEVDNALQREQRLTEQQQQLQHALFSAEQVVAHYQYKYRNGLVDVLDVLQVQQQAFDLETQLNTVTYQHLSNRITLGLALGLGVSA
ncbi:RND transporter [Bacterioplanes sanyensis]|uniref:RND transporter n=1 Tax=Bacterioplanes sanyensis TaxID=1249553 RepID=A0A222FGU0_9GAMM|nr:TolC family protein [Bacterioplanes sanyensis]ASP38208.1 RND transporter [Bacterioplanes sanyensis]